MKLNPPKPESIHSWPLFLMSFSVVVYILCSPFVLLNLALVLFILLFYFQNGLSTGAFLKIACYAFLFSVLFFCLNVLYPKESLKTGEQVIIYGSSFYLPVLNAAFKNFFRIFLLSVLSMSSAQALNYDKVILYLMTRQKLKAEWGYSILIALNSIALFKEELGRITLAARLRGLPRHRSFFVFFPLLVFAIRHSQRGAQALVTRGLNPHKNFYFNYGPGPSDQKRVAGFFVVYVLFSLLALSLL